MNFRVKKRLQAIWAKRWSKPTHVILDMEIGSVDYCMSKKFKAKYV